WPAAESRGSAYRTRIWRLSADWARPTRTRGFPGSTPRGSLKMLVKDCPAAERAETTSPGKSAFADVVMSTRFHQRAPTGAEITRSLTEWPMLAARVARADRVAREG